jgi:hypothetical protein
MKTKLRTSDNVLAVLLILRLTCACAAGDLDTMGVTLLRTNDPTLTGAGIPVAQPEAEVGPNAWEVNPAAAGPPRNLFTWINTNGSTNIFPNLLGAESYHADAVGSNFYGSAAGVAPGVSQVDNYNADYLVKYVVAQPGLPLSEQVINQSFIFTYSSNVVASQEQEDAIYDTYIATNGGVFCSGVGNGGPPNTPSTAYNGIGVGCYGVGANSSTGPTLDNGRSKPDLVAPAQETSFSTPYAAGAAAVLLQAAARGDGGANTNAAGDIRTVKALLLNGAVKPGDWTHTSTNVLDTRYGAGVVNLYYSHQQLAGGQQSFSDSELVLTGSAHPPGAQTRPIPSLLGWDYQTETNTLPIYDAVNHYYFDNSANPSRNFTLTATLVWNRAANQTKINNLALFLYNTANSNLVAESVSMVDNVQQIYAPSLPRGQYDLQVVKYGGPSEVSDSEIYALAFQFYPISPPLLGVALTGTNVVVSWPWSPTIFNLEQTTNLAPPVAWTPVATVGLITNTTVCVTLSPAADAGFYQLSR